MEPRDLTVAPAAEVRGGGLRLGAVELTVRDLPQAMSFYRTAIGLIPLDERVDGSVRLGSPDGSGLLALVEEPHAAPVDPRASGLFHFAVLVPSRAALADALWRLVEAGWSLTGASDHLVSEALYLHDPEGNGIEIYRDRPAETWPRDPAGRPRMDTVALDLEALWAARERDRADPDRVAAGTQIGHVHLQVGDLTRAEPFYHGVLGLEVTARAPGALFLADDGYHHHVGLNVWNSRGAAPRAAGSAGLAAYEVSWGTEAPRTAVLARAVAQGVAVDERDGVAVLEDPAGNRIRLLSAAADTPQA